MGNSRRNGKIDFMKFVFAVVIVLHHGVQKVLDIKNPQFIGGSFAVEFFFIVSGYLLMAGIQRLPERTQPLGMETGKFMLRKFKGFYPEVAVAFIIGFAVEFVLGDKSVLALLAGSFQNAFLMNMTGISVLNTHGELWYISSMLLCMMIMYPLIRKYPHMMTNVVLPLAAVLIMGYFCGNETNPRNPLKWMGFTYKGNLRAFAEIGIGVCLYPLVQRMKTVNFSKVSRILLTVVEWGCYIAVLEYMRLEKATRNDYFFLAVYIVAILISFSQQGIDAGWFQKPFFSFLGKVSFPLYLAHNCWAKNINEFLPAGFSNKKRFVIYLGVSAVATLVIMLSSALLRKLGKALKNPAKKIFLAKEEQPSV